MLVGLLGALLCVLPVAPATAHVQTTTGYSEIRQTGQRVDYRLSLELALLRGTLGLRADAPLDADRKRLDAYLAANLRVDLDGVRCPASRPAMAVGQRQGVAYAELRLSFTCAGSPDGAFVVDYQVFSGPAAVVDEHLNVADYAFEDAQGRFVFDGDHTRLEVGSSGPLSSASRFVVMGVQHIAGGADHVLFLLALVLGAPSLVSLAKVASAFTAAHSTTLALAAIGGVDVPGVIVEPLIALSIAWVAVHNAVSGGNGTRLPVVFGFGLLHGLGFAGSLSFTDEVSWRLLSSLLTFNLGIELGQALIVLLALPVLLAVRRQPWSGTAHLAATGLVGLVGLAWFAERLLA